MSKTHEDFNQFRPRRGSWLLFDHMGQKTMGTHQNFGTSPPRGLGEQWKELFIRNVFTRSGTHSRCFGGFVGHDDRERGDREIRLWSVTKETTSRAPRGWNPLGARGLQEPQVTCNGPVTISDIRVITLYFVGWHSRRVPLYLLTMYSLNGLTSVIKGFDYSSSGTPSCLQYLRYDPRNYHTRDTITSHFTSVSLILNNINYYNYL